MPDYIEQLNECTDPASGDWLWIVDISAASNDMDRKLSVGKIGRLASAQTWTATQTFTPTTGRAIDVNGVSGQDIIRLRTSAAANALTINNAGRSTFGLGLQSWTPAFSFEGGGSVTYAAQVGRYALIGGIAHVWANLWTSAISSPSGNVSIVPPVTPASIVNYNTVAVCAARDFASTLTVHGVTSQSSGNILLYKNGGQDRLTGADLASGNPKNVFTMYLSYWT